MFSRVPEPRSEPVSGAKSGSRSRRKGLLNEAYISAQRSQARQAPRLPSPHGRSGRPSHHQGPAPEGPASPVRLIGRVRDKRTFDELRRSRRRVRRGPLSVSFVPGGPGDQPRVAYAIGKRAGGAVQRNRLRRRLRALVAELAPQLAPGAYLIGAAAEALPLSHGELRSHLSEALRDLT